MASSREYLDFVLDLLSGLEGITYRTMMGEFILYDRGRIFGGIYDNRFLVKVTPASLRLLPDAQQEEPYPGAKPMLLVPNPDDRALMEKLVSEMYSELPEPKPRKGGSKP